MSEEVERLERLRARLREGALDGLVVSAPSNLRYLSGFRGSIGIPHTLTPTGIPGGTAVGILGRP